MSAEKHCIELAEQGEFERIKNEYPTSYIKYYEQLNRIRNDYMKEHIPEYFEPAIIIYHGDCRFTKEYAIKKSTGYTDMSWTPGQFIVDFRKGFGNWASYKYEDTIIAIEPSKSDIDYLIDGNPFRVESRKSGGFAFVRPKLISIVSFSSDLHNKMNEWRIRSPIEIFRNVGNEEEEKKKKRKNK
jgi:hypothetical protein